MRGARLIFGSLLTASLVSACGRSPMDEDERGKIVFWLIDSASASQTACTDDADFSKLYPEAPNLQQDGISYYYIYLLGKDGKNAVSEDCDPQNWNSCTPDADMIFRVDGDFLRLSRSEVIGSAGDCDITETYEISIQDKGTEAEGIDRVTFKLEGSDCEAFEAQLRDQSKNGFGIRDCVAERRSHANYSHARVP